MLVDTSWDGFINMSMIIGHVKFLRSAWIWDKFINVRVKSVKHWDTSR